MLILVSVSPACHRETGLLFFSPGKAPSEGRPRLQGVHRAPECWCSASLLVYGDFLYCHSTFTLLCEFKNILAMFPTAFGFFVSPRFFKVSVLKYCQEWKSKTSFHFLCATANIFQGIFSVSSGLRDTVPWQVGRWFSSDGAFSQSGRQSMLRTGEFSRGFKVQNFC